MTYEGQTPGCASCDRALRRKARLRVSISSRRSQESRLFVQQCGPAGVLQRHDPGAARFDTATGLRWSAALHQQQHVPGKPEILLQPGGREDMEAGGGRRFTTAGKLRLQQPGILGVVQTDGPRPEGIDCPAGLRGRAGLPERKSVRGVRPALRSEQLERLDPRGGSASAARSDPRALSGGVGRLTGGAPGGSMREQPRGAGTFDRRDHRAGSISSRRFPKGSAT